MHEVIRQLLLGTMCVTAFDCSSSSGDRSEAIRREVLRGNDLTETRRKAADEHRLLDDNGALIPSNVARAGITLPRGFEPKFVFDYEWNYDGHVPLKKLEDYFRAQLDSPAIQRTENGSVVFGHATVKGSPSMTPVSVTILPVAGREEWSRIQILAARPLPIKNFQQIKAELAVRRHSNE